MYPLHFHQQRTLPKLSNVRASTDESGSVDDPFSRFNYFVYSTLIICAILFLRRNYRNCQTKEKEKQRCVLLSVMCLFSLASIHSSLLVAAEAPD